MPRRRTGRARRVLSAVHAVTFACLRGRRWKLRRSCKTVCICGLCHANKRNENNTRSGKTHHACNASSETNVDTEGSAEQAQISCMRYTATHYIAQNEQVPVSPADAAQNPITLNLRRSLA